MRIDNLQRKIEITHNNQEKASQQKAIDQEIETLYSFDFQVITLSKKDWKSKKIIGSDEFIREKYREWQEYQQTG